MTSEAAWIESGHVPHPGFDPPPPPYPEVYIDESELDHRPRTHKHEHKRKKNKSGEAGTREQYPGIDEKEDGEGKLRHLQDKRMEHKTQEEKVREKPKWARGRDRAQGSDQTSVMQPESRVAGEWPTAQADSRDSGVSFAKLGLPVSEYIHLDVFHSRVNVSL